MDLNEAAQHVRPKTGGFYDGLTVDGIRAAVGVARVYWDMRDAGPVHLNVEALALRDMVRRLIEADDEHRGEVVAEARGMLGGEHG